MIRASRYLMLTLAFTLVPSALFAQGSNDAAFKPGEPDFTLISLPTSLRLPRFGSEVHFTHRFSQDFNHTDFSEFSSTLFGLDSSAVVGLEYRIGIARNVQVGIHHSGSNRTWAFFSQIGLVRQGNGSPLDVSAIVALDVPRKPKGNDFERDTVPSVGTVVSHAFGQRGAVYVEPIFVSNVFNEFGTPSNDDHALLLCVGARVRVSRALYLVGEVAPRVSGFDANTHHAAFAIEKRVGGHVFQVNASNSFATTLSQLAMGGGPANDWHLGFNITRKFF